MRGESRQSRFPGRYPPADTDASSAVGDCGANFGLSEVGKHKDPELRHNKLTFQGSVLLKILHSETCFSLSLSRVFTYFQITVAVAAVFWELGPWTTRDKPCGARVLETGERVMRAEWRISKYNE